MKLIEIQMSDEKYVEFRDEVAEFVSHAVVYMEAEARIDSKIDQGRGVRD